MKINIVLVEPEIPQNTGNIARTCAATDSKLHLVHPLGFDISEKQVRRAGLDYWDKVDIEEHESLEKFLEKYPATENHMYFLTTKGQKCYTDVDFSKFDEVFIVFGKETKGLPEQLLLDNLDTAIRIPMKKTLRSLNLSNSAAIVTYELLRQANFNDLEETSVYLDEKYSL
ncbi:MAG: tRNA (uridine(34)/cytosine(34)/5-carboxymethylaminomethyluridine(34)-2'-O)-methyltransferase TrmL [Clostridia bacterium]|nr:tRNA (uridine(34)/cytosine(34)/5-carboxymethylaminomethyluridine(34)-2'-O)-methyltransferase TrmL [Clostridia bacterium]